MLTLHYLFIHHFKPQSNGNTYVLQGASTECQPTAVALKTHAHRRCHLWFFLTHAQVLSSFYFSTPRHTHRQTNTCKQTNGQMSIEGQWKVVTEMFANGV